MLFWTNQRWWRFWKKCFFFEEIIFIRWVINISENMHITFFRLRIGSRFVLQKSVCMFSLFSKKKKMEMKNKAIEKFLFHGTSHDVVDAICFQNFDFRVCGKNGTNYGKGVYFSKSASYSHRYSTADSKCHYFMFLANVLVGKYAMVGAFFISIFFKKPWLTWHFFLFLIPLVNILELLLRQVFPKYFGILLLNLKFFTNMHNNDNGKRWLTRYVLIRI